ncbi:MAG: hypothetical protein WCR02_05865 [Sphaerochaetaceae bacterium]
MSEKKFSLKTMSGSWHYLLLFIALIVVFALLSQVLITDGYKINITNATIDVRGADLNFEIYKPANVSSADKLPCIILTHGGSEALSADTMMAWQLALRGFVVINVSAYGAGLSDQPAILEDGTTGEMYNRGATMGMYDVYEYAKSMAYVDPTRIGAWAHSTGRHLFTKMVSYFGQNLTLNDRLLNVLYNNFGVQIAENQLTQNADEIAKKVLSSEDLVKYFDKKAEQEKIVSEYLKTARLTERAYGVKAQVAGYTVIRDPQMNLMIGLGTHEDKGNYYLGETEQYRKIFHTGSEAVTRNGWYDICDYIHDSSATSTYLGEIMDTTAQSSPELKTAIANGTSRYFLSPVTVHNGMLWSPRAIKLAVEYYVQTLQYNRGNLDDSATKSLDSNKLGQGYWALLCSSLAFVALLGAIVSLVAALIRTPYFSVCAKPAYRGKLSIKTKDFWIWVVAATLAGFAGAWACSQADLSFTISNKTMTKWLPWEPGQVRTFFMLIATAVVGALCFIAIGIYNKKKNNQTLASLSDVNLKFGWRPVLRSVLLAYVVFIFCYVMTDFIKVFFDARFLFIDVSLEMMKAYGFARMIKYTIICLPFTLVISILNNLTTLSDVSDTKDDIINVVVTSLGMIILIGIGFLLTYSRIDHAEVFHIHCILSIITLVPVTNFLYKKLFKLTGSVWVGAIFVALFLGWRLSAYISHQFMFYGPSEIGAFWGIY